MSKLIDITKTRYKVGLDVDDVLLPCIELAVDAANKAHKTKIPLVVDEIKGWVMPGCKEDVILEYFEDENFFMKQKPFDGAAEFVAELSKRAEIFFVTAVRPDIMEIRSKQLQEFFPQVPKDHYIPASRKDMIKLDFMLDDRANILKSKNICYPIIFRKPWNSTVTGCLSVNTYNEFINVFDMITGYKPEVSKEPMVICLVGPSASGKTAIVKELEKTGLFERPISSTTRKKRKNEDDDAYIFLSENEFLKKMENNEFVETTIYSECHYGMQKKQIEDVLEKGLNCIVPIDISGAFALRQKYKAKLIYVDRSDTAIIHAIFDRIKNGDLTLDEAMRRIVSLKDETQKSIFCHYRLINDTSIEDAANEILNLVKGS